MNTSILLTALLSPIGMCQAQQAHAADTRPPAASPSENAAQLKRDVSTSIGYATGIIFSQKGRTPITMDVDIYMTSFQTAFNNGIKNAACKEAAEKVATITDADEKRTAQSISNGFNIASSLLHNGFIPDDIDMAVYRQAFEAALQGKVDEEKVRAFDQSSKRMLRIIEERDAAAARANLPVTKAFLKENSGKPGIVTMPDGLQYKIEKQGTGRTCDEEKDGEYPVYVVKYTMSDIHGNILDDYTKAPTELMGPVYPEGLDTALSIMPIGSTWTLFLSPELGFGEETSRDGRISIPGNSVLVMRVELLDIHALDIPKVIPLKTDDTEPDGSDNETSGNNDE